MPPLCAEDERTATPAHEHMATCVYTGAGTCVRTYANAHVCDRVCRGAFVCVPACLRGRSVGCVLGDMVAESMRGQIIA